MTVHFSLSFFNSVPFGDIISFGNIHTLAAIRPSP